VGQTAESRHRLGHKHTGPDKTLFSLLLESVNTQCQGTPSIHQ